MSGWGSGYVTDIAYMTGYYRHQSPSMMALACLLGGVASPLPAPDDPVSYLELGCGQGLGALVLAASNPRWTRHRDRLQSGACRRGARLGGQAGLDQHHASSRPIFDPGRRRRRPHGARGRFRQPARGMELGAAVVQAGIVRLLRAKVTPGGAVHVSYNALPAWGRRWACSAWCAKRPAAWRRAATARPKRA